LGRAAARLAGSGRALAVTAPFYGARRASSSGLLLGAKQPAENLPDRVALIAAKDAAKDAAQRVVPAATAGTTGTTEDAAEDVAEAAGRRGLGLRGAARWLRTAGDFVGR